MENGVVCTFENICLLDITFIYYILQKQKWRDTVLDDSIERNDSSISAESEDISKVPQSHPVAKTEREDNHHYVVELADWKSKVRKQRQELYVSFKKCSFLLLQMLLPYIENNFFLVLKKIILDMIAAFIIYNRIFKNVFYLFISFLFKFFINHSAVCVML